jgi:ribokinase
MTATARRHARICRDRYLAGFGGDLDITVVGHIARDVVLGVDAVADPRGSAEVRERRELLGGKGANQAVACAQLGASVALLGVVGDDEIGARLLAQARADRVDVACAVRRPGARTALIVTVVEAGGDWRHFEDLADADLTAADIENAKGTLLAATSVIVQLQQPAARVAAALAHAAGRRVVLDGVPPADDRADLLAAADVLRADAHEGGLVTGVDLTTVEAATRAARELVREGPSLVALGVDGEGDVVAWSGGEVFLPFSDDPVVDTTGGGDAFTAAFTVTLTRGGSPEDAARAAAAAAGSTVRRLGGRPALDP